MAVKYPYRATQVPSSNPFMTDPGYLAALAAEQSGTQQADAALKAAREQAITQFGAPELAQARGVNVDPLTAAMAQQATRAGTSTIAGLQQQRDTNQQNILDSLAAHGMLQSGQTGYATTRNQQAYGQQAAGATQTLLSGLDTANQTDLTAKQGLHSDVVNALTGAYTNFVNHPALYGAADTAATSNTAGGGATFSDANTGGMNAARNANAVAPVASALTARPALRPSVPAALNVRAR